MQVTLTTTGASEGRDDLARLRRWLAEDDAYRGRVRTRNAPIEPGTMGPIAEALILEIGGPAVIGLSMALLAWLRRPQNSVDFEATNANGTKVTIRARDVRKLDAAALETLAAEITDRLTDEE
jgi:hypothetical protein